MRRTPFPVTVRVRWRSTRPPPYVLAMDFDDTSCFPGRESLLTGGPARMARWRKTQFAYLSRNSRPATQFFGLPLNRVVELGAQIEL